MKAVKDFYEDIDVYSLPKGAGRKYYKYESWTQPTLSSNGTIGGGSFAVTASAESQASGDPPYKAWEAFDKNSYTYWRSGQTSAWLEFYNPEPLRVTNLQYANTYCYPTQGTVIASNDNSNWDTLTTWTNNSIDTFNIDLSSNTNTYLYYRVVVNQVNTDYVHCQELTITAQKVVEGTSSDYDFYEDVDVYYGIKF